MKTPMLHLLLSFMLTTNITFAMTPLSSEAARSIRGLACGDPEIEGTGPWCAYGTGYVAGCQQELPTEGPCGIWSADCIHTSEKVIVDRPIRDGRCISNPASQTCCTTIDVSPCIQYVNYDCTKTFGVPAVVCFEEDDKGMVIDAHIDNWYSCKETQFDVKFPDGTHKMAVECL